MAVNDAEERSLRDHRRGGCPAAVGRRVDGLHSERAESGVPLSRVLEAICASAEDLGRARVTRRFAAGEGAVRLADAEAVPVAVALNELVSNAVEHGERAGGVATIEVSPRGDENRRRHPHRESRRAARTFRLCAGRRHRYRARTW